MRQNSYTASRYQRPAPAHHQLPRRRATGESHRKQISDAPDAQSSGIPPLCDGTVTPQTDSETTGAKTVSSPLPCDRIITRRAGSTVIRTQPSHTSPPCDTPVTPQTDSETTGAKPGATRPPCNPPVAQLADSQQRQPSTIRPSSTCRPPSACRPRGTTRGPIPARISRKDITPKTESQNQQPNNYKQTAGERRAAACRLC